MDPNMQLSDNFTLGEFIASRLADENGLINEPESKHIGRLAVLCQSLLEPLRTRLGDRPILITSGFRTIELNEIVPGSSETSHHMSGWAADIRVPGVPMDEVFMTLWMMHLTKAATVDQVIRYPEKKAGHVHVSVYPSARGEFLTARGSAYVPFTGELEATAAVAIPPDTPVLVDDPEAAVSTQAEPQAEPQIITDKPPPVRPTPKETPMSEIALRPEVAEKALEQLEAVGVTVAVEMSKAFADGELTETEARTVLGAAFRDVIRGTRHVADALIKLPEPLEGVSDAALEAGEKHINDFVQPLLAEIRVPKLFKRSEAQLIKQITVAQNNGNQRRVTRLQGKLRELVLEREADERGQGKD